MDTKTKERLVYSVYDLVELLGISISSVYKALERNEIPHIKVGSRILIPKKMLDEWLSKHEQPKPINPAPTSPWKPREEADNKTGDAPE